MSEELRRSGLEIIGDVPWGTHFCQFYRTAQDLLDILVPYFAEGLANNEFCMWVTSEPLGVEAARAAIAAAVPDFEARVRRGQIEIIPHSDWYLRGGTFDADRVLGDWVAKLERARAAGFDGLRLTGNTFWLEPKDWRAFTDYEAAVDGVIGQYRMLAVCTYSLDRCGFAEILDVIRNHRFALVRREGRWELVESTERRRAEEALRASEEKFRNLFASMTEGCALHEIVVDGDGRPVDYRFLDVNPAFERMTGLPRERTAGRLVTEVLPGIEPFWIETYGRVALTGEPATFERYYPAPLDKTYQIYAYCPAPGQFAAIFLDITERKRTEAALQESHEELEVTAEELRQQNEELVRIQAELQESEERFRIVASSTPDHVIVQDRDLRYTMVINPQLGLTEKDMLGKTDQGVLSKEDAERLTAIKRGVLDTGKPVHVDMPIRNAAGSLEYFDGSYIPRFDAQGKTTGLLGYFRNVTERKRAEEQLRWLAQFPEQNPNPVFRVALDGGLIYANRAARALIEAMGGAGGAKVPEPLLAPVEDAAKNPGAALESEIADSRGNIFWFAAVRPAGEAFVNLYARDITKRKQAERKSEYRALLLSQVHDAVVGVDAGFRVTYWNKGAERMFGFSEAEAAGRSTVDLLRPVYRAGERERILEDLERRGRSEVQVRMKHKDGREVVVEAHSTRLAEASGGTTGFVVVYRDITGRVKTEAALQESHEELEVASEELRQQNDELLRIGEELAGTNQKLSQVLDSIQDDFYVLDRNWVFVYVNRQFASKIGKGPAEFIGRNIWGMFPKHVGSAIEENFRATMEKREVRRFETAGRYTDAWYSMTSFPSEEGITVLGTDVTVRKHAEETLRRNERRERERAEELKAMNEELARFNRAMVGRETRMIELKKEINELCRKLGEPQRYATDSGEPE